MNAQALMLLLLAFVKCFTAPGFEPFQNFIIARPGLLGLQHSITELMRLSQAHTITGLPQKNYHPQKGGMMITDANKDEKF